MAVAATVPDRVGAGGGRTDDGRQRTESHAGGGPTKPAERCRSLDLDWSDDDRSSDGGPSGVGCGGVSSRRQRRRGRG